MRFYVLSNGKRSGPFSSVQLRQLAKSGRLSPNDQICKETDGQWHRASQIKGLFDQSVTPASRAPAAVKPPGLPRPVPLATSNDSGSPNIGRGLGIASLCIGVLAIGLCWIPLIGFTLAGSGLLLGVFGFVLSFARKANGVAFPLAGSSVSMFAFIPSIVVLMLLGAMGAIRSAKVVENGTNAPAAEQPLVVQANKPAVEPALKPAAALRDEAKPSADARPSLEDVVARSVPSVALIQGHSSSGTGFVIGPNVVATNKHVISSERVDSLKVHFPSGTVENRGPFPAKLLYEDDLQDLAFLRVECSVPPLPTLDAYRFRQGQEIVAIGNPGLGNSGFVLKNAINKGVMSSETSIDSRPFYQLGISINPGNSGGPVLDDYGRVLGVVTLKAAHNEGLAFCIPVGQLHAAFARSQTLGQDELRLVEYNHQMHVRQESEESPDELQGKLTERSDIDPAVRGRWRLFVTSEDGGTSTRQFSGVSFAYVNATSVQMEQRRTMRVRKVYICHDDDGNPGNLLVFSDNLMWIITKKPRQEFILVQVVGLRGGKTKETFRFVVTADGAPGDAEAGAAATAGGDSDSVRRERERLAAEREQLDSDRRKLESDRRTNELARKRFGAVLTSTRRLIKGRHFASARANLQRIIQSVPGTEVADEAQQLLDSLPTPRGR